MTSETKNVRAEESFWDEVSPFVCLIALFGIPAAGCVALTFLLQIPRLIDGQADVLPATAEIGSLLAVLVLVLLLRSCLELPSAPRGFYRNVLDFLAMARWHPAVKAALVGLLVLPPVWYIRSNPNLTLLRSMGWRALAIGDVQDGLDGVAVVLQLVLTGGVPLLFGLHMFSRSFSGSSSRSSSRFGPATRILPWLLVPLIFLGAAIGMVVIVAMTHH